jgi:hypothetical protein
MVLVLAGAGIAHAQPAGTSVCKKLNATLASLNATLKAHPTTPKNAADIIASQLTQAASTGSPAVKSAVRTFIADLEAGAAANDLNLAKLNADAVVIANAACTPSGAPATGGGSAVGIRDPGLLGVGGAAVLAGILVLCLTLRNRPRTGVGHG